MAFLILRTAYLEFSLWNGHHFEIYGCAGHRLTVSFEIILAIAGQKEKQRGQANEFCQ